MKKRFVAIGGLLLPEDPKWEFRLDKQTIVGRRENDPGSLQIMHVSQDTLPQPVTHDFCLAVLRAMLKFDHEPTDRQMHESVCGPYGAATFIDGEKVVRAWYCRRPPGLVVAVYLCPRSAAQGPQYNFITNQCAYLMSKIIFDRASWGAPDDPLTEVLTKNFERLEHEHQM